MDQYHFGNLAFNSGLARPLLALARTINTLQTRTLDAQAGDHAGSIML